MVRTESNDLFVISDPQSIESYKEFQIDDYGAYIVPYSLQHATLCSSLREIHKVRLKNVGYLGYDDSIDNEYHTKGIYCFITFRNRVVLTSRINSYANSGRFPFEMGIRSDGGKYALRQRNSIFDINTYGLVPKYRKKAMPYLLALFAKYLQDQRASNAYGLVDEKNTIVQRIYNDAGFRFSKEFNLPVFFPTFIHSNTMEPVNWLILEWNKDIINKYYKNFNSYVREMIR